MIQTADNHRPYTIPEEDKNEFVIKKFPTDSLKKYGFDSNDELNAFRYTDFSYQKFIEAAKKETYFNNTIFVFVGDHGIRGDAGNMFPKAWEIDGLTTQHVPLLFYAPAIIKTTTNRQNLFPDGSSAICVRACKYFLSPIQLWEKIYLIRREDSCQFPNTAFLFDPNIKQIGVVTDEYCYVHNLIKRKRRFSLFKQ